MNSAPRLPNRSADAKRPFSAPTAVQLSPQRRQRFALILRALDGRNENKSYRAIAEGLFGKERIPERAWKTHDLRNLPFASCNGAWP